MLVNVDIIPGEKREIEQWEIDMIEAARKRPIVYDEDCPKLTVGKLGEAFDAAVRERNRRLARSAS